VSFLPDATARVGFVHAQLQQCVHNQSELWIFGVFSMNLAPDAIVSCRSRNAIRVFEVFSLSRRHSHSACRQSARSDR
jgi:hypothetical protein